MPPLSDQSISEFWVLEVEVTDDGDDLWSMWSPTACVAAKSGHDAIKMVAKKLGDGLAIAVPVEAVTARHTWVVRSTHTREATATTEFLAPELLPAPKPESDPEAE